MRIFPFHADTMLPKPVFCPKSQRFLTVSIHVSFQFKNSLIILYHLLNHCFAFFEFFHV